MLFYLFICSFAFRWWDICRLRVKIGDQILTKCCLFVLTSAFMLANEVGNDEVARAKAQIRANLLMSRESVSSCADALARQIILFGHPQSDAELLDAIDGIDG